MMFTDKAQLDCKKDNEPENVCEDDATTTTSKDEDERNKKSQRQRKDNPTSGAMSNDGKPTRRNNIPLLTGSVQVGLLYDAKSDRPLYGDYLWPPPKNDATSTTPSNEENDERNKKSVDETTKRPPTETIVADVAHSSMDYIFDENILDRLSLIGVTAELKLSFMGGLIEVIYF